MILSFIFVHSCLFQFVKNCVMNKLEKKSIVLNKLGKKVA